MKNLNKFRLDSAIIISILAIGIIFFAVASTANSKKALPFKVLESKVSISGTRGMEKWKLEANAIKCNGSFEVDNHELMTISELSFTVPINELKSDNHQLETTIYELLKKNNCYELSFKQQYGMILPIMKKIHVMGGLTMLNETYSLPIQADYELQEDQRLIIRGKKLISLSECGIKIPNYLIGIIDDEVSLEVEFVLEYQSI